MDFSKDTINADTVGQRLLLSVIRVGVFKERNDYAECQTLVHRLSVWSVAHRMV